MAAGANATALKGGGWSWPAPAPEIEQPQLDGLLLRARPLRKGIGREPPTGYGRIKEHRSKRIPTGGQELGAIVADVTWGRDKHSAMMINAGGSQEALFLAMETGADIFLVREHMGKGWHGMWDPTTAHGSGEVAAPRY